MRIWQQCQEYLDFQRREGKRQVNAWIVILVLMVLAFLLVPF